MQKIVQSRHNEIYFDEKNRLIEITRTVPADVTVELYKEETLIWAEVYSVLKPKLQIVDMKNNFFIPGIELQKWINENLLSEATKNGLIYVAFIVSNDYFVQISHEVIMEQSNGSKFTNRYFNNKQKAKDWLISTQNKT